MSPSRRTIKIRTFPGFCHIRGEIRWGVALGGTGTGGAMQRTAPLSRRRLLGGMAAMLAGLPARAQDQADQPEMLGQFRILRARTAGGGVGPGPVLRVRRGEEVKIRLINE